jgi:two-component system, cell cycle sensor histidine kinase and response regulator CckA
MDITERVRLERSLLESEQTLRLAVDAARMGLWRWDSAQDQLTWDARTCEIFGVDAAPASYRDYLQLIHPDDRALVERVVREAQLTGMFPTVEHRLATSREDDGRWLLAAGKVLVDAEGRATGLLGGVLDISEQKRWARQLQRAERVEALGQLTAGIAHNFNNLLAAILPNVELALLDAQENIRPLLAAALDASLQARDLIKSLISLAGRPGAQAKAEPSDPGEVVKRLERLCLLTFPREIELQTSIEPGVEMVAMPASDLEQVLLNLLLNARDAVLEAPAGPRRIQILVDSIADPRRTRIRVVDSGVGMSDAVRDQIFVPFFTTKPLHRGTGLGLANALSRVREAAGQLDCDSRLGSGSTFTLLVPESAPSVAQNSPSSVQALGAREAETLLVVDDEPMVRSVVARLLGRQRYTIVEAGSAAQARELLRQHGSRVRLILLDQSMPGESGLEALPSLHELSSAPVVLFTGLATEIPAGVAALLEKPARPAELLRTVRECLDAAQASLPRQAAS